VLGVCQSAPNRPHYPTRIRSYHSPFTTPSRPVLPSTVANRCYQLQLPNAGGNQGRANSGDNTAMAIQQWHDVLFSQGFGTRRVCAGLVQQGFVSHAGVVIEDSTDTVETEQLQFEVQGVSWAYHNSAYLVLHKPCGYECSQKPSLYPSIYTLLPAPLRQRGGGAAAGVQAVGRLDQDTTGLLVLSDDGKFIHRLTSPKHHVPKVYEVTTKHPVDATQIERLLGGVVLDDSPKPVAAFAAEQTGECALRLTLTEGKYHQVKRMLAAVSNRVEGLHRSRMGGLTLDGLPSGEWRWLTPAEVVAVSQKTK
jgi:16S rRNA pseudouridine516 synthase